jgi:hypothetical protein
MRDWATLVNYLFWLSALLTIVGALSLPLLAIRIPADYFSRPSNGRRTSFAKYPFLRLLILVLRNTLASVLFAAGIIMLFTPGQGLLMLLVALSLARFPGKRQLERKLIALPGVSSAINKLRAKRGKPPLQMPSTSIDETEN